MNKEEKEAIEIVKTITYEMGSIRQSVDGHNEDLWALEKVLNLIEKQQQELENIETILKEYGKKTIDYTPEFYQKIKKVLRSK